MSLFFKKHLKNHPPAKSEIYELKICRGTSQPFDSVREHQVQALLGVANGFYHKITDPPMFYGQETRFNAPRPFDCFYLTGLQGYVVIWFYKPRATKEFIKIKIQDWMKEKRESVRKSITEERAKEIGLPFLVDCHE